MLHFFRKIRRDLIDNSKFYKYFKYAIGEIVLVVIGILIALQINNWNEEKKNRELFDNSLVEVEKELIYNIENLKEIIDIYHEQDSINILILFDGLNRENFEKDTMYRLRWFEPFQFEISTQSFEKLVERTNEVSLEQDSLYTGLKLLYAKDWIQANNERFKACSNAKKDILESFKKHDWYVDRGLFRPYTEEEIDFYLNNVNHKKNIVDYGLYVLNGYVRFLARWEHTLVENYKKVYTYLEEQNIHHSDSLLFGYNPDNFKHYIGKFKPVQGFGGFETFNTKERYENSFLEIELIDNKFIISDFIKGKKMDSIEIIPITKYYYRTEGGGGYNDFIFDDDEKVSGLTFTQGTFKVLFTKIE